MRTYQLALIAALVAGGALPDTTVHAETPKTLEERVSDLEKKNENPLQTVAGPQGFSLKSEDGNFALTFQGLIQADGRFYTGQGASGQTDTFLLRRVRPILSGTLYRFYDFLITPDFGGGTTVLYDAYLDIPWSYAKLRVGKFKPPVGLERLQSDATLTFAERGLTSNLLPQRDVGAQFFGEVLGGALGYQAAFTNGVADGALGDTDVNDGKEGALRIFTKFSGVGLGVAGTYTGSNTLTPTYKTASGQQTFFSYNATTIFDGERSRFAPQANYYHGPFGVFGEYAETSQVARVGSFKTRLTNSSWQAAASYVLTGEAASYGGVVPRQSFDPQAGTWGAFELGARYHQLYIDPDTFTRGFATASASARKASAYTVGVSWYLNKAVKILADYEETWFEGGISGGNRPIERVFLTRWQLSF